MHKNYDIIIIGTGAGGGTLAYGLREAGARILLVERGDYLPQEPENWQPEAVFRQNRYKTKEIWEDAEGRPFKPGVHYYVGGNTKVYGAALPRFRREDFDALEHEGGTAPAWPIRLPGGAVRPAMNAATGLVTFSATYAAASSSAVPPISPIISIASVSSSAWNIASRSIKLVPTIGSPPSPTQVDCPRPSPESCQTAS